MGFFEVAPKKKKVAPRFVASGCAGCGREEEAYNPRIPAYGEGREGILIIGEQPSKSEDRDGEALVGKPGRLLEDALYELGYDMERDCRKMNAVACYSAGDLEDHHVHSCRKRVLAEIQDFQPSIVLLLGNAAIKSVIGHTFEPNPGGVQRWRGFQIPDQQLKTWLCPTWHPSFILNADKKRPQAETIWLRDLRGALARISTPVPSYGAPRDIVHVLTVEREIVALLRRISRERPPLLSFDYETRSLKPHREGTSIRCIGVCFSEKEAYAFPLLDSIIPIWINILDNAKIGKTAHNMKFEDGWSRAYLGIEPRGWEWCSMLGGHIEDNRQFISGLDFQAYAKLGVPQWDADVSQFIKANSVEEKRWGGNAFNQVHVPSDKKLLTYCGMDAWTGFMITKMQQDTILNDEHLAYGYDLFHKGALALSEAEQHGMLVDVAYCERMMAEIEEKEKILTAKLMQEKEIKRLQKRYGPQLNLNSDTQIRYLLYTQLKCEAFSFTDSGEPSTGGEALEAFSGDYPWLKQLLQLGKYNKLRTTYLAGLLRETINGVCHPFFHLHTVQTYRSSSANPNWQNLPIRDKEMGAIIRKAIKTRKGRMIVEIDYSGVEVRIAQCYHNDPRMLQYIEDASTDMHRDTAMDLFLLSHGQWVKIPPALAKELRQTAKNGFVFAQFYGDYYLNCAKNIWNQIKQYNLRVDEDTSLFDWLEEHGIGSLEDFMNHVQIVEASFWEDRFTVYNQWRKDWYAEYQKNGEFELYSGFRCTGLMSRNESINYPVQGAAFHCLLWSFATLNKWLKNNNMDSYLVAQIHDSLILDVNPDELTAVLNAATKIMTQDIKKQFPWIIVPLDIEADVTPIDSSWHDKKAVTPSQCRKCDNDWVWKKKSENHVTEECPVCGGVHSYAIQ